MREDLTRFENASEMRFHDATVGQSTPAALANSPRSSPKGRILWVDDDVMGTQIRAEPLGDYGYLAVVYYSPEAVLNCDFTMFDLGILDFEMPRLNGRDFCYACGRWEPNSQ